MALFEIVFVTVAPSFFSYHLDIIHYP